MYKYGIINKNRSNQCIAMLPEEDGATDTGNMHKKLVKIERVVLEIWSTTDRQTK